MTCSTSTPRRRASSRTWNPNPSPNPDPNTNPDPNPNPDQASLIKDMDKLYSAGSRIATEMGGVVERLWGNMSAKQGDENSLRIFYAMAEQVALTLI